MAEENSTRRSSPSSPLNQRSPRAASVFLAALAKTLLTQAAAISSPYILQESKNIFESLVNKASLKFSASMNESRPENVTFQDRLDHYFANSPTDAAILHDRLKLSVRNVPDNVYSMYAPDVEHARAIRRTARQLQIFRDKILTSLPQLLLEKVLASIPHPVRRGSQIIVNVRKSLTFYILTYYVECEVESYAFTNITAFSMPYIKEGSNYYAASIQNDILSIDFQRSHSLSTIQSERCAQQALSNVPTNLFPDCKSSVFTPHVYQPAFRMKEGQVVFLLGPGILQISCFQKASQIVTLSKQFNLLYINYACEFNIKHKNLSKYVRATTRKLVGLDFKYLLAYDVTSYSSRADKVYYWLIGISIAVILLVSALFAIILLLTYCKRKYQPTVTVMSDGAIECSLVNCSTSRENLPAEDTNPFTSAETVPEVSLPTPLSTSKQKLTKPAAH